MFYQFYTPIYVILHDTNTTGEMVNLTCSDWIFLIFGLILLIYGLFKIMNYLMDMIDSMKNEVLGIILFITIPTVYVVGGILLITWFLSL